MPPAARPATRRTACQVRHLAKPPDSNKPTDASYENKKHFSRFSRSESRDKAFSQMWSVFLPNFLCRFAETLAAQPGLIIAWRRVWLLLLSALLEARAECASFLLMFGIIIGSL